MCRAMARATMSVEPPAGNGTTMVTGFSGQAAGVAVWAVAANARPQALAMNSIFLMNMVEVSEGDGLWSMALWWGLDHSVSA